MIGQIILWVIIFAAFALMFKVVYDSSRKEKWFNTLKPGDKIKVWIYSQYCECLQDAEVVKSSDGKYIEAKVLKDCKICSEFNSKDKDGKETCWYNVTKFTKKDVGIDK